MNNEKENYKEISEQNDLEIQENADELEVVEVVEPIEEQRISTRTFLIASILGVLLISIIGFAAWRFLRNGEAGKPVPAPRNSAFGDTDADGSLPFGERTITLTDEQLKAADFRIVEVGETFDAAASAETTTGVVKANDYEQTPVISQVSGVVKSIKADLGQFVRKGQIIAIVASEELANTQSKYLSMKAELDEAEKRYKRALQLSDISPEAEAELDKSLADLKIAEAEHIRHRTHYQRVKKLVNIGAKSRDEFEEAEKMHATSKAQLDEAVKSYKRAKELLKINPARKNETDQFLTKVRNQKADIASIREKLLVLGLPNAKVNSLNSPNQIDANLPISSPISGTITERIANQGEVISMNGKLAQVTDLSTIWVIGQVYEKDLGKLRVGSGASVTSDAYSGEVFRGQISYVDANLDTTTRTAQVRIELANPGQKLKIGQFVNVAYAGIGNAAEKTAPLVPKDALQTIGNQKVVFQSTDDPKTFIIRPIRIGQEKENAFPVREGIFVGDKVVTDGSFLLRAEFLKTNSAN